MKETKKNRHKHKYSNYALFEFYLADKKFYAVYTFCPVCGKLGYQQEPSWAIFLSMEGWRRVYPTARLYKLEKGQLPTDFKNINEVV